jgi:3-deoxy-D-manno-octulosonic-acid transferase
VDLVERKGVFAVENKGELADGIRRFLHDEEARKEAGQICRDYIQEKKGATERVMTGLREYLGEPRGCQGSGVRV